MGSLLGPGTTIKIFVSPSSAEGVLAAEIADLLMFALSLDPSEIRCTSVVRYGLPHAADSVEQLRSEVLESKIVLGLITQSSVESSWALKAGYRLTAAECKPVDRGAAF